MTRVRKRVAAVLVAAAAGGCALLRPTPAPIPVVDLSTAAPGAGADALFILLPGRFDRPGQFAASGFAAAVARRHPNARIVAVDAHLGYYIRRSVVDRVYSDVVVPALRGGTRTVILAGVSLGGLGSLLVARDHHREIDAIVAIAPFLGDPAVIEEIAGAGGLARWTPPEDVAADDYQRELWRWLKGYADAPTTMPHLVLAYGRADEFAAANAVLGAALPPDHVFVAEGGHDWKTWSELWVSVLDAGVLPSSGDHP